MRDETRRFRRDQIPAAYSDKEQERRERKHELPRAGGRRGSHSETRNALAISAVLRPHTVRSDATCASCDSAG